MSFRAITYKFLRLGLAGVFAVGALVPTHLLVFCIGSDDHRGVELAHDAHGCAALEDHDPSAEAAHACCDNEAPEAVSPTAADHGGCCEAGACEDTHFPAHSATTLTHLSATPKQAASASISSLSLASNFLSAQYLMARDTGPSVSPLVAVSVIRR